LGFSESGHGLQQRLSGAYEKAFLVARDPVGRAAFHAEGNASLGIRHDFGAVAMTVTSERGEVASSGHRKEQDRFSLSSIALDGKLGPADLSFAFSRLRERGTVLGGRFSDALSNSG